MKTTNQQGFILPITLIILALLTVMSMGLSKMARHDMAKVQQRQHALNGEIQLKNSQQWVIYRLLTGKPDKNKITSKESSLLVDNQTFNHNEIDIQIQDVAGLMGLAIYQSQQFEQLLIQLTDKQTATQLAAQLKDWIDKDQLASYQGMEAADYIKTKQTALPRNNAIRSLDELLELPSMTKELFNGTKGKTGLKDLLLAGGVTDFNVATAPDMLIGPMLGVKGQKLAQIRTFKKMQDWQHLEKLIAKIRIMDFPFSQGFQYRIIMTLPNGHKSRSLVRLKPARTRPYQQKLWQYPDNDRG